MVKSLLQLVNNFQNLKRIDQNFNIPIKESKVQFIKTLSIRFSTDK